MQLSSLLMTLNRVSGSVVHQSKLPDCILSLSKPGRPEHIPLLSWLSTVPDFEQSQILNVYLDQCLYSSSTYPQAILQDLK